MCRVDSQVAETRRDDDARKPFAKSRNCIGCARRHLAHHRDTFHQLRQFLKVCVNLIFHAQAFRFFPMELVQFIQQPERLVTLATHSRVGNRQQLIGGLAHRRHHHHGPPLDALPHDARDAFDCLRRFDGGAAEFHHDH